jgi:putative MFS transporter
MFSEYLPTQKRGRYLVLLEAFWALGTIVAAGLAWLVVPRLGWRWLLALSAVPGLIIFLIRRMVPESPRYLLTRGKTAQAFQVLQNVAATNGNHIEADGLYELAPQPKTRMADLLRPNFRQTTIFLWLVWFFISFGYYGIFTWLPNYFRSSGMEMLPVYRNTFILALAQLPGYFSAAYLVEKWGRKKTLAVYLLLSGVFTYLFAAANSLGFVVFMGIWMSFFALGAWGALYAFTPEVYPTALRGTGMGTASAFTRISGAIAPTLGGLLLGESFLVPMLVFSGSYILAAISSYLIPIETKDQPLADTY